jgi:O-antigen ligase
VAQVADRLSRWAAVAIGASIPVSVALDNILLSLVLLAWLAGGDWREKWRVARLNPVALAALVLFAVLAAGTLWGSRYPGDAQGYLVKYVDLLAVPALVYLFRDARHRGHALMALAAGLVLTLLVSYLVMLGLLPQVKPLAVDPENALAFKFKLTHNILMAFAAFLFARFALHAQARRARCAWAVLSLLAAIDVLFLVNGLTGQILLGVFALYGGYLWKGWRGLAAAVAVAAVAGTLLVAASDPLRARLSTLVPEFDEWRAGKVRTEAPVAIRLDLYATAADIVRDQPLFGAGTGGYPKAHAERAGGKLSRNPHNEYLLIAAQTGLAGLAALLWLFWIAWRVAARLSPAEAPIARALVLMLVAGCLVNSMLLDHTEGLLFAWLAGVLYAGLPPRAISH